MPLYDYHCPTCGRGREVMKKLAELELPIKCLHCNGWMNRKISAPMVVGDYPPYSCPITGKLIEGRRQHQENLARHDCRILEPGERQQAVKYRQSEEAALDKSVDETVDRFIAGLPTDKRDKLGAEMDNGLDVQVTRQTAQGT